MISYEEIHQIVEDSTADSPFALLTEYISSRPQVFLDNAQIVRDSVIREWQFVTDLPEASFIKIFVWAVEQVEPILEVISWFLF